MADPRTLVLSRYVSFVQLQPDLFLCGHAFKGPRCVVEADALALIKQFTEPYALDRFVREQAGTDANAQRAYLAFVENMQRQGVLIDCGDAPEDESLRSEFGAHVESARTAERRIKQRAPIDPRLRGRLRPLRPGAAVRRTWKALYLGCCLVLPSMDAVVELAAEQGIAIQAIGSVPSDLELIAEEQPDFVVLGDVRRIGLAFQDKRAVRYIDDLRALLTQVRSRTSSVILLRNLPGPSCSLLGLADRGKDSWVNTIRKINIDIAALAEEFVDTYVVDIDQALSLHGRSGLVDDSVVLSHHLGSLTWLAERACRDDSAAGSALPSSSQLLCIETPRHRLETEYILAAEDLRWMLALQGVSQCKCVVVDLDNTLWPGVLAETGQPFPANQAVDVYPHHIYLGLHEALLALRERGILLACISKNDESVVRDLWKYPATFDGLPTLKLSDFASYRINWKEKADNLIEIAEELGLGIDSFAFIDDNPHERDKIAQLFPAVRVLGDNLYAVRYALLTDPAYQVPRITEESRRRSELARSNAERKRAMASVVDQQAFRDSLQLRCQLRRETDDRALDRIAELVLRTNQLNTTGERISKAELRQIVGDVTDSSCVYTLTAADKFANHGLVGACVTAGDTIRLLVLSCRVLGLGLEDILLQAALRDITERTGAKRLVGILVRTDRNQPARRLFENHGFRVDPNDAARWILTQDDPVSPPRLAGAYALSFEGFSQTVSDSFRT